MPGRSAERMRARARSANRSRCVAERRPKRPRRERVRKSDVITVTRCVRLSISFRRRRFPGKSCRADRAVGEDSRRGQFKNKRRARDVDRDSSDSDSGGVTRVGSAEAARIAIHERRVSVGRYRSSPTVSEPKSERILPFRMLDRGRPFESKRRGRNTRLSRRGATIVSIARGRSHVTPADLARLRRDERSRDTWAARTKPSRDSALES